MAYGGFDDPMAQMQAVTDPRLRKSGGGGWKALLGLMFAAAGVGFAGYVYFVPYQKLAGLVGTRTTELAEQRTAAETAVAERDKLKSELARRDSQDKERAAGEGKKQASVAAVAAELKTALGELGGTVSAGEGKVLVAFPIGALFEQPTSTGLSAPGTAAIKILAGVTKKSELRARVKAKLIMAPPPKELQNFPNIGAFAMLRAARVALALADGGVAPAKVAAVGEAPGAGKKNKAATLPDRLDIEIEPE